jgi:hypothetical protein
MKKKKPPIFMGAVLLILLGSVAAMNAASNQPDPQEQFEKKVAEEQEKARKAAGTQDEFSRTIREKAIVDETGPQLMFKKGPAEKVKPPEIMMPQYSSQTKRKPSADETSQQWYTKESRWAKDRK